MLVNLYEDISLTRPRDEQWRRKISFCGEDKKGEKKNEENI